MMIGTHFLGKVCIQVLCCKCAATGPLKKESSRYTIEVSARVLFCSGVATRL